MMPSSSQMISNAQKVALPALAIGIISNIPTASGGPITEICCIIGCHALFLGNPALAATFYSQCLTICLATGLLPTP